MLGRSASVSKLDQNVRPELKGSNPESKRRPGILRRECTTKVHERHKPNATFAKGWKIRIKTTTDKRHSGQSRKQAFPEMREGETNPHNERQRSGTQPAARGGHVSEKPPKVQQHETKMTYMQDSGSAMKGNSERNQDKVTR